MLLSDRANNNISLLLPMGEAQHCFFFVCFYFSCIFLFHCTKARVWPVFLVPYTSSGHTRSHCINTHLAGAGMKGLVSNWKVLLSDSPHLWPNAVYVCSVMKWMMEIDLLVKTEEVARFFPF